MIHILLILTCVAVTPDSVPQPLVIQRQTYKKQIAVNGLLGIGLAATTGVYWKKGDEAYDLYKTSMTTRDALYYWEQTQHYDRIRNVCAIGALFFIGRTVFYYAKLMDSYKTIGSAPYLDVRYTQNGAVTFGVVGRF